MLRLIAACIALLIFVSAVQADTCSVRVNGLDVVVDEDMFTAEGLDATRRERLFDWTRRSMDHIAGSTPNCRSNTVLVFMGELTARDEVAGYCLEYGDDASGFLLIPGERNFRGRCKRTTCDKVEAAADDLIDLSEGMSSIFGTPPDSDEIARSDSFGAVLVSGSQRFLIRRLNNMASATFLAALSAPSVAAAGAVTLVTVGGGVFLCRQ